MDKYYLFGAGVYAHSVFDLIGEENIVAFIDNNKSGIDKITNKKIISFEEYLDNSDYEIIVATSEEIATEIDKQLQNANVESYILFYKIVEILNESARCDKYFINESYKKLYHDIKSLSNDSSVEFYLVDSFEIFHYLPIYNELCKRGIATKIIAEPAVINSAGEWFDYKKAIKILEKYNINYGILRNKEAKIAITTQYGRNLRFYKNKKAQLCYGAVTLIEKAFQLDCNVAKEFDMFFVHGDFQSEIIKKMFSQKEIIKMSYPKFIDFKNKKDKKNLKEKYGFNTEKPILIYLPTWDEYSSIEEYAVKIGELRDKYFVISKPHHCTEKLIEKSNDMKLLMDNSDLLLKSEFNIDELADIGDVVLCDGKSAVVYEMIFLNQMLSAVLIMNNNLKTEDFYVDIEKVGALCFDSQKIEESIEAAVKMKNNKMRKEFIDYLIEPDIKKGFDCLINKIIDNI